MGGQVSLDDNDIAILVGFGAKHQNDYVLPSSASTLTKS